MGNINVEVTGSDSILNTLQTYRTIVLKPNIHDVRNILPINILNEPNTKYVIKWDFDLGGQTVYVGENCIIEFDGGSFKNGILVGNNTVLLYYQDLDTVIKDTVELQGTFVYNNGSEVADEETLTKDMGMFKIKDNGVDTKQIKNGAVTYNKLAPEAVDHTKVSSDFVDNEDIHFNENHSLQLKNKAYNPADFSGLGKVYLRKNVETSSSVQGAILTFDGFDSISVTVEQQSYPGEIDGVYFNTALHRFLAKVLTSASPLIPVKWYNNWLAQGSYADGNDYNLAEEGTVFSAEDAYYRLEGTIGEDATLEETTSATNILTQSMINQPNTIYHIQYDYDLNGESITVPEGCVLQFEGGSLGNGTIVGQSTVITGVPKITATTSGTWSNIYADVADIDNRLKASGNTRPTTGLYTGYQFFDTTLGHPIYWNGTKWVDENGFTAAKHRGSSTDRLALDSVLTDDDTGFCFYDTTLAKPVYAGGSFESNHDWYDVNGDLVVDE